MAKNKQKPAAKATPHRPDQPPPAAVTAVAATTTPPSGPFLLRFPRRWQPILNGWSASHFGAESHMLVQVALIAYCGGFDVGCPEHPLPLTPRDGVPPADLPPPSGPFRPSPPSGDGPWGIKLPRAWQRILNALKARTGGVDIHIHVQRALILICQQERIRCPAQPVPLEPH